MDYQALLHSLKTDEPTQHIREFDAEVSLYRTLAEQAGEKVSGPFLDLLSMRREQFSRRMHEQYGIGRYFSGKGHVGQKLTELTNTINWMIGRTNIDEARYRELGETRKNFHASLTMQHDHTNAFRAWVAQLTLELFGAQAKFFMPLVPIVNQTMPGNMKPMLGSNTQDRRYLTLCHTWSTGHLVSLSITDEGTCTLMYWHAMEEVWLMGDSTVLLSGTLEGLKRCWEVLKPKLNLPKAELNISDEYESLTDKVNRIFDEEAAVPMGNKHFVRENELSSQLRFWSGQYCWTFVNTKGTYAQRSNYLTKGDPMNFGIRVSLADLSPLVRHSLLEEVHNGLNNLLVDLEQAKAPKPVTARYSIGSGTLNPVWQAQAKRGGR